MSRRRAFTLLELLLALAVTVVIAGTLATTLFIAFRARGTVERAVIAGRATGLVGEIVARDLVNALPPGGTLASDFSGTADTLRFHSTTPSQRELVAGDVKRVEYYLVSDPASSGAQSLCRRITANLLQPIEIEPADEIICRGVSGLELSYYDGSAWTDEWDSTALDNRLPQAVRLVLQLVSPTPGAEPLRCERMILLPCAVSADTSSEVTQ